MISKEVLEKFKALYREKTGKDIPDIDALENDTQMTVLAKAIYKPMTKEEDEFLLIKTIKDQFILDINSIHGLFHWEKVKEIGDYLAKYTRADKEIVRLFAYLHDAKRESEDYDPDHGLRAAGYAQMLFDRGFLPLDQEQLDKLKYACTRHSEHNAQSDDITVQTCWDADRLDLCRLGITPDSKFLYTEIGKKPETIDLALKLVMSTHLWRFLP